MDKKFDLHKCKECGLWHDGQEVYIITNAKYGTFDNHGYCLSIDFIQESRHFFLFFHDKKQIKQMLKDAKAKNVGELVGKPCFVYRDENNTYHFVRMWSL